MEKEERKMLGLEQIATGEVKVELQKLAQQCATKLGIPESDVFAQFQTALMEVKQSLPSLDAKTQEQRAFVRVKGHFKQELRSPAKTFEGLVLGVSQPFDMIAGARKEAQNLFKTDPTKAVMEGYTTKDGAVLDRRQNIGQRQNANFGKALPAQALIQNAFGIARAQTEMGVRTQVFRIALGDRIAGKVDIPLYVPNKFRANIPDHQPDPNEWKLNPYAHITFTPAQIPDLPPIEDVLSTFVGLNKYRVALAELEAFHQRVSNDPQRVCIVQADVAHVSQEPNPVTGNRMITLDDASLPSDHPGYVVWVAPHLFKYLDFGTGSRVIVSGATVLYQPDKSRPPATMMNAWGLYAIPRFKIPPDEVPEGVIERDATPVS